MLSWNLNLTGAVYSNLLGPVTLGSFRSMKVNFGAKSESKAPEEAQGPALPHPLRVCFLGPIYTSTWLEPGAASTRLQVQPWKLLHIVFLYAYERVSLFLVPKFLTVELGYKLQFSWTCLLWADWLHVNLERASLQLEGYTWPEWSGEMESLVLREGEELGLFSAAIPNMYVSWVWANT